MNEKLDYLYGLQAGGGGAKDTETLSVSIDGNPIGNLLSMPTITFAQPYNDTRVVSQLLQSYTNITGGVAEAVQATVSGRKADKGAGVLGKIAGGSSDIIKAMGSLSGVSVGGAGIMTRAHWSGNQQYWQTSIHTRMTPMEYAQFYENNQGTFFPKNSSADNITTLINSVTKLLSIRAWLSSDGSIHSGGNGSTASYSQLLISEIIKKGLIDGKNTKNVTIFADYIKKLQGASISDV